MWTRHTNATFAEKKKKKNKESVLFPPISNGPVPSKKIPPKTYESTNSDIETSANLTTIHQQQIDKSLHLPVIYGRLNAKAKARGGMEDLFKVEKKSYEKSINASVNHVQVREEKRDRGAEHRTCFYAQNDVEKTDHYEKPSETAFQNSTDSSFQVNEEPPKDERRFMIYLCGGYKDSVAERRSLMETVYPRLYLYCKQRGYDFRMIDLRCGVGNPISEHHDTVQLHLDTLKKCQETHCSSFFLFVGQKYEVRSLPPTIQKKDFEAILRLLEKDKELISKKKSVNFPQPTSKPSMSTDTTISNFQESIYGHYLSFGDEVSNSEELDKRSLQSFSEEEEGRLSPVGARSVGDVVKELSLLQMWYKLDMNSIPPIYRLLPISTHYPDILSVDKKRKRLARKAWMGTLHRLWKVLHYRAAEAMGQEPASELLRTVLEWEVEAGVRSVAQAPPEDHCHCYKRIIPDLLFNLRNKHVALYVDLLKGQTEIDPVLSSEHQQFMERIHKKLRHTNIYERKVGWGRTGLDPKHNRSHHFYTERICSHVQRTVINSINKVKKNTKNHGTFEKMRRERMRVQTQEEIQRHVQHSLHLAKNCTLRHAFLDDVKTSLEQSSSRQVLLLGPPGWGKSTVMAALAQKAPSWLSGTVKVLVVFIGYSGESRNIRLVLQSLCVQLAKTYRPETQLSEGLSQLINEFHSLLALVDAARPVVILLDGLDEVSDENGLDFSWILTPIPKNVYLIFSATTNSSCTQTLMSGHSTVLSLPPLSLNDITTALESKLQNDQRHLQQVQWNLLVQACVSCPCPLYLEIAYSESLPWTSYTVQASLNLPGTLQGLYINMLSRLERDLGRHLVRQAAMLISISRHGVTEEEILHLLSKDGKVLQEVSSSHTSSSSLLCKLPYIQWVRLKRELGHQLSEVRTDDTWVYRWTHSELAQVCFQRYFRNEESRMAVHADYADYYREKSPNAHIFQPLAWILDEEEGDERARIYQFNLRKLRGLPHHLVHSGQIIPFLSECVFNYEFLLHKVWGLSVLEIEEDLKKAVLPDKEVVDVEALSGALELSRSVLLQDPCQLASQLMGRLGQMVMEDRPIAKGDPLKFQYLHALLAQCAHSSLPVLLPSSTCLLPPGGLQHMLLAGPLGSVTALGGSHKAPMAVTCEEDGSIKFWDLEQRRIIRGLDPVQAFVADSLALGLNDKMLILRMGQSLQVREVESGRVVYTEDGSVDIPIVTTALNGQFLVVFYDGTHLVKVFDLAASCFLLHYVTISLNSELIHRNNSIVLSSNSIKDYVLFAHRCGSEAGVFSATEGTVLTVLSARHAAASIQAVDMTDNYLLLFCRYPYRQDSQIIHIELFSTESFQYERSILGCSQDCISQVTVNHVGTHAVAFCSTPRIGITGIVTWNLETEDHKHITQFPGILTKGLSFDLRFCLGICRGERYLRLWDLTSRITDQTLTYNIHKTRSDGTKELIPMGNIPRYAVCLSTRPGTVFVWNLCRHRFTCRPAQVQHGLYSSTDVVLVHDLKVYILTDRSSASRTQAPPHFQTLLVFDLIKRSYVRRQTGLAVIPCPQQEYRLLENGATLLGLSETRDHLILWNLDSGSIKHQIHSSHRDGPLSSGVVQDPQPPPTPRTQTLMPWDVRTESQSAKKRRLEQEAQIKKEEKEKLEREKFNAIDQYMLSGDEQLVICSYFAHHLNVFSITSQEHLHTLEDKNSLLDLHTAAVTYSGTHLVLTSYNQKDHSPSLLLWDLHTGTVDRKLPNEPGVCCVALTNDASRVVFGVTGSNKLKVWEPFSRNMKIICGYDNLRTEASSTLYMTEGGTKAILLSGHLSVWDVEKGNFLSTLSMDANVSCMKPLGGSHLQVLLGLSHSPALVNVWFTSGTTSTKQQGSQVEDVFEESSSSEEEGNS